MGAVVYAWLAFRMSTFTKYLLRRMMTSSNGNTFCFTGHYVRGIHRSPVNSPHKGQRREALVFSLICAWINGWVNNREAGNMRRHRAHCEVTVMELAIFHGIKRCSWNSWAVTPCVDVSCQTAPCVQWPSVYGTLAMPLTRKPGVDRTN